MNHSILPMQGISPEGEPQCCAEQAVQCRLHKDAGGDGKPFPVTVAGDKLVHIADARRDLLTAGKLQTFCGKPAVTGLRGLPLAQTGLRCQRCYSMIDAHGYPKVTDNPAAGIMGKDAEGALKG